MAQTSSRTTSKKLLTPKQKTACELISEINNADSPRAEALLLVNAGITYAQAAEKSGLTLGQVKYWVTRFRNVGLACFTADMPSTATEENEIAVEKPKKDKKKSAKKQKKEDKPKKEKKKAKDGKKDKKEKEDKKGKKNKKKK